MTRRSTLLLTLAGLMFVQSSVAQQRQTPAPDPYRNFVGKWSGVVEESRAKLPKTIHYTITERPDHKAMIWDCVFGEPGQPGYDRAAKTVTLDTKFDVLTMKWKGEDTSTFSTTALDQFLKDGDGTFAATLLSDKSQRLVIKLNSSKLTYQWIAITNGKWETTSKFVLDRVPDSTASQTKP